MTEEVKQDFKLVIAEKKFLCQQQILKNVDKPKLQEEILSTIFEADLAPMYKYVCTALNIPMDAEKYAAMKAKNEVKLDELDKKLKDAEENLGETEVRDALHAKADYLCELSDKEAAIKAYQLTEEKTAGAGNKVDLIFSQIRLFMLYGDWHGIKKLITKAKTVCDEGGDWDRKNKLKVYEATLALYTRDFKLAADLFLDSTATFTTDELFPYSRVVFYAVLSSLVALDRPALKKRVVDAPEVLTAIGQIPHLGPLINSLYNCKYNEFFKAYVEVVDLMKADMYLHPHARFFMREVRLVAYSQFLESYKSVTIDSMAAAFDVSPAFLDAELVDFIVPGRLHASIDKVSAVIETNRPDEKNAQYQDTIKKGDLLLNRIQKLSKIIDVE